MNSKLIRYDLRHGILRWHYCIVPLCFLIGCTEVYIMTKGYGIAGTWLDYLLNCFAGSRPVEIMLGSLSSMTPPFGWLMTISGCLFLNLDYMIGDLTTAGQQMILRSRQRTGWFLSKCAWNIVSCMTYVLCLFLITFISTF